MCCIHVPEYYVCIAEYHKKKQEDKEKELEQQNAVIRQQRTRIFVPRTSVPRVRHEPYPVGRVQRANSNPSETIPAVPLSLTSPSKPVVKTEPSEDSNDNSVYQAENNENSRGSGEGSGANDSETDPNVSVKLEAINEDELELEITGVEPGTVTSPSSVSNVSMDMSYAMSGASGSQADLTTSQGYSKCR